jgi:hypothetical protein
MRTYKVVRQNSTVEAGNELIKIWDGGDLLWEREGSSFIDVDGKMMKLSDLSDVQIVELYRKQHE